MKTRKKVYSILLALALVASAGSAALAERTIAASGQPQALGDSDLDMVFTPVAPCRIVNTKNLDEVIGEGSTRQFLAYGEAGELDLQGGDANGCPSPVGEPLGVHVNVTVVPGATPGNVRVYPAGEETPWASLVNFRPGVNIANAATIQTTSGTAAEMDLEVYASKDAYVIMDVMGYYSAPEATTLDTVYDTTQSQCAPGLSDCAVQSPTCPEGYKVTGGSCSSNSEKHLFKLKQSYTTGSYWECAFVNNTMVAVDVFADVICARVPGR